LPAEPEWPKRRTNVESSSAKKPTEQLLSSSGIPIKEVYVPADTADIDYNKDIGLPGKPPYTRGVYPSMYRGQAWTIRRLSGFNTPEESNKLFREEFRRGSQWPRTCPPI
jgi:methylmalonyl-CoA mutase N-terminal domain/subunit